MGIHLGGKNAYKVRKFHDLVVAFHWVNGEPAMCIYPLRARPLGNRGAAIICLSALHQYVDSRGNPIADYLIPKAMEYAECIGFGKNDRYAVKLIADAILEHAEDLVKMPPEPEHLAKRQQGGRVLGEMTLTANGQRVHEQEVRAVTVEELARKPHSYGD